MATEERRSGPDGVETVDADDVDAADILGSAIERREDPSLLTGDAEYTDDIQLPDSAHAAILRSQYAHARIEGIDTSEAEAMDGVHAVLTPWSDAVPDAKYTSAGQSYPEPSLWDMNVLNEHVRYVGDPVAAVAAEDPEAAAAAVESVEVEYEEYDHVVDPETAFDEDAPRLFEESEVEDRKSVV